MAALSIGNFRTERSLRRRDWKEAEEEEQALCVFVLCGCQGCGAEWFLLG